MTSSSPMVFYESAWEKPKVKHLRATDILVCVHAGFVAGAPMDNMMRAAFRHSLLLAVAEQLQIRGMYGVNEQAADTEVDIVESEDGYHIMTEVDWTKKVDRLLCNRDCQRCGSLLAPGLIHGRDECDLVVLRDVLES